MKKTAKAWQVIDDRTGAVLATYKTQREAEARLFAELKNGKVCTTKAIR